MLGLQNEREWKLFCERVLEQPELAVDDRFASNSKRTSARDALREVIVAAFAKLSAAQVIERLDQAGIANAQMNTLADVWAHPQLKARERWHEVGTAAGAVPALLPPGLPTDFDPRMDPVPALGQHTDAILARTRLRQRADRRVARSRHDLNRLSVPACACKRRAPRRRPERI